MCKLLLSVCCALALLATATVSDAKIYVNISDGTTTLNAKTSTTVPFIKSHSSSPTVGLKLSQPSLIPAGTLASADVTDTLTVLFCPTRPCTVFFPSGAATQQTGDTFKIQDIGSTSSLQARVVKFDSGSTADRVSHQGVKYTSLVAGKILTITYGNTAGDLRALTAAQASSYSLSALMSGSFKTSLGARASACKAGTVVTDMDDPTTEACVRLSIALNGTPTTGQQGNTTTVSVPCNGSVPAPPQAALNPCGGGTWTPTNGAFSGVTDSGSISCPSACSPAQESSLVARFNGANEVLQMTASSQGSIANVTDENGGGEESLLAFATEIALPRWVTFSAAIQRCRAEPKTPSTNDSHNISDSNLPISIEYWCGNLTPAGAAGVPLVSLADTVLLPGAASTRYEASRETFLPAQGQLQLKNITTMGFTYDVFVGTEAGPVDGRLGPLTYSDPTGGALRLEIQLLDSKGVDLGTLKVYLCNADNGRNVCDGFEQIGLDVVNNPVARVDPSGLAGNLAGPCCITFGQAQQGTLGNSRVRKIAFIVSRPVSPASDPADNYKVQFFDGNVNGVTALSSLMVATGFTRVPTAQLSTTGVSIVITKLSGTNNLGVVKVIRSGNISTGGNNFTVTPNISMGDLFPESGARYAFSLCPSGVETDLDPSLDPKTVLGICIANQAILLLN
jgi:hypothetical protein